ncbi:MAG: cyclase family protein [Caldilineaceae bacterium]|nr:cyclase family protein [Caldilineaceae bacterium]
MNTIIDLSLPLYHGMRGVAIHPHTQIATEGYNTTNLQLYSHAGTHMDAPLHFLEGGATIDQWDLHKCVGPAQVLDLSHKAPNSLITIADVEPYAAVIQPGARLLLRTDWDSHAELPDFRTHFPRISRELAKWFVAQEIGLLGVQTPSVAALADRAELQDVHQILLRGQVVIVECLAQLNQLPPLVTFVALPLKIKDGDGSPVRAIALF